MKRISFRGGVHPPQMKDATAGKRIEQAPLPKEAVVPLLQHTGAPCQALVSVGARVRTGEKIGDAEAFISAPVHATISGKVIAIEVRPHPIVGRAPAIVIESDGRDESIQAVARDPDSVGRDELIRCLREAGIVGLGGAAFPSAVKLSPPEGKKIDVLILNGAECEPYLTADDQLMREEAASIIAGGKMLRRLVGASRVIVGIEKNKPEALEAMTRGSRSEPSIEVIPLKTKYPQGGEKQLILALLRREVPSGGLPMDAGVLVHNVGTVYAAWEAVTRGRPLVGRVLTVTGPGVGKPANLRTRIGVKLSELLSFCDARTEEGGMVIAGGPMMGVAQYSLEAPVVKGTSGVLVFRRQDVSRGRRMPCIQCGTCADVCPANLLPTTIAHLCEKDDLDTAEVYGLADCIECGSCAYGCPSAIPLVAMIKLGKATLLKRRRAVKVSA